MTKHVIHWKQIDPDGTGPFKHKDEAKAETLKLLTRMTDMQIRLYAEQKQSLLIILQGMDTSGKDGVIRRVIAGMDPQGCLVTSFKAPSIRELSHDFLWRIHPHVPGKGMIAVFNRSHYEDVLITHVHKLISDEEAQQRLREINAFEAFLARNGVTILKFYLAISKGEQRERLQERVDNPEKRWKFNMGDLEERKHWDRYQKVYSRVIEASHTKAAPWHIIPANHKWYRNYEVARIIVKTLKNMDPRYPTGDPRVPYKTLRVK